jgi:aryl-alcohol dehydrogenase-like predicted oxidoreductase
LAGRAARIVTKLGPLADLSGDALAEAAVAAADASFDQSLKALGRDSVEVLLLHRAEHRTAFGGAIWQRLKRHRDAGRIGKLGVSVQSPQEALAALDDADVEHIQLPFNLLDARWREAGVVEAARARPDVAVHARSIFLQGLLAANDASLWPETVGVDADALTRMIAVLAYELERESPADLCLAYVRAQDFVRACVVGLETEAQLEENLRLFARPPLTAAECTCVEAAIPPLPGELLNPALWMKP